MLIHDSFSSVGVTLAILRSLVVGRPLPLRRSVGLDDRVPPRRLSRVATGLATPASQVAQLPWFARNLVLKVLIVAKLTPGPWPY